MTDHRRGGFTLAEMLIVIGILAALAAVSFAGITSYHVSLTAKRLDSAAEELFLYAQNRLVYMQSLGSDDAVRSALRGDPPYILAGDGCDETLVSAEMINSLGGRSALIEIDPYSGDILAVFFSDTLSAQELEDKLRSQNGHLVNESHAVIVGCYGSDDRSIAPREYMLEPNIAVLNGDKLILEISCEDIPYASLDDFSVRLTLSSDIYSEDFVLLDCSVESGALRANFTIDSITQFGGSYFIDEYSSLYGDGILGAKAVIYCKGYGVTSETTAERRAVSFDPLFDSRSGESVMISCVRHLNNLRFLADDAPARVYQICDLGFDGESVGGFCIAPLPDFKGVYDGCDNYIYGLRFDGNSSEYVGLFSSVSGCVKNTHIVSGNDFLIDSDITVAAGVLSGYLGVEGKIENCSVSGIDIKCITSANGNIGVGGLVGASAGTIERCSSCADITLSAISADFAAIGGLVGIAEDGSISYSHASGRLGINGSGDAASGIAYCVGGSVSFCYSECSTGYIGGADYYGVSNMAGEQCYYVAENAWLASDRSGAVDYAEFLNIDIDGFGRALRFVESPQSAFPESVSIRGVPTRFGGNGLTEPRGLIGVLRVEYVGGGFNSNLLTCFDAYDNASFRYPEITWGEPYEGEVRYYLIVSDGASPQGTDTGWEFSISSKSAYLGNEETADGFNIKRIIDASNGDVIILRFGTVEKALRISLPEAVEEEILGGMAVIYRAYSSEVDLDTGEVIERYDYFDYYYCGIDVNSDSIFEYDSTAPIESARLPELENLTFDAQQDGEMRIYSFSSAGMSDSVGITWNFSSTFDDAPIDAGSNGVYRLYELFRGNYFSEERALRYVYDGRRLIDIWFAYTDGFGGSAVKIRTER